MILTLCTIEEKKEILFIHIHLSNAVLVFGQSPPEFAEIEAILTQRAEPSDVWRAAAFFKLIRYSYGSGCTSYGCQSHERFSVGDQILVRILSVKQESLEDISITADAKSVSEDQTYENLKKCRVQSKYSGKVTDVRRGVVYVRLTNGVNGVAHSCYDRRLPGKKDDVSFAVTRIDEERGVAVGIITRIIKQHL